MKTEEIKNLINTIGELQKAILEKELIIKRNNNNLNEMKEETIKLINKLKKVK